MSEAEISREAADMEMNREKYVEELKKALIAGEESVGRYNFAVSRDDENTECHFSYERNLKDGSVSIDKCFNLNVKTMRRTFLVHFCIVLSYLKSADLQYIFLAGYCELCHGPN